MIGCITDTDHFTNNKQDQFLRQPEGRHAVNFGCEHTCTCDLRKLETLKTAYFSCLYIRHHGTYGLIPLEVEMFNKSIVLHGSYADVDSNVQLHVKFNATKLPDERVLIGRFVCVDRDCNLVLSACTEYRPPQNSNSGQAGSGDGAMEKSRFLNFGHIPGRHVVKVKVLVDDAPCLFDK
uniref:Sm domain-containing protein n=1 Tax=Trichuris muris TaxID=70415 RepID=A0A5S6QY14_TRIMR